MDEVFAAITATAVVVALTVSGSIGRALHFGYVLSHWLGAFLPA